MATLVGFGTFVAGNNASLTPAFPANLQTGDILYAWLGGRNATTGTWTAPAGQGWELIWSNRSATAIGSTYLFAKRFTAGDTAGQFVWSGGGTNQTTLGGIGAVRGVPTTLGLPDVSIAPEIVFEGSASSGGGTPTISVAKTGDVILALSWTNDDTFSQGPYIGRSAGGNLPSTSAFLGSTLGTDAGIGMTLGNVTTISTLTYSAGHGLDAVDGLLVVYLKIRANAEEFVSSKTLEGISTPPNLKIDPIGNLGDPAYTVLEVTALSAFLQTQLITWPSPRGTPAHGYVTNNPPGNVPIEVPFPSGSLEDDLLVVSVCCRGDVTGQWESLATPAGVTPIGVDTAPNNSQRRHYYAVRLTAAMIGAGQITFTSSGGQGSTVLWKTSTSVAIKDLNWVGISGSPWNARTSYPEDQYRQVVWPGPVNDQHVILDFNANYPDTFDRYHCTFPMFYGTEHGATYNGPGGVGGSANLGLFFYRSAATTGSTQRCLLNWFASDWATTLAIKVNKGPVSDFVSIDRAHLRITSVATLRDYSPNFVVSTAPLYIISTAPDLRIPNAFDVEPITVSITSEVDFTAPQVHILAPSTAQAVATLSADLLPLNRPQILWGEARVVHREYENTGLAAFTGGVAAIHPVSGLIVNVRYDYATWYRSADTGQTWEAFSPVFTGNSTDYRYHGGYDAEFSTSMAAGNGVFVSLGVWNDSYYPGSAAILWSSDGLTWNRPSSHPTRTGGAHRKVVFNGERFFSTDAYVGTTVWSSVDGDVWTECTPPGGYAQVITAVGTRVFVGQGGNGGAIRYTDDNGETWTSVTVPDAAGYGAQIITKVGDNWVAFFGSSHVRVSKDLVNWSDTAIGPPTNSLQSDYKPCSWPYLVRGQDALVISAANSGYQNFDGCDTWVTWDGLHWAYYRTTFPPSYPLQPYGGNANQLSTPVFNGEWFIHAGVPGRFKFVGTDFGNSANLVVSSLDASQLNGEAIAEATLSADLIQPAVFASEPSLVITTTASLTIGDLFAASSSVSITSAAALETGLDLGVPTPVELSILSTAPSMGSGIVAWLEAVAVCSSLAYIEIPAQPYGPLVPGYTPLPLAITVILYGGYSALSLLTTVILGAGDSVVGAIRAFHASVDFPASPVAESHETRYGVRVAQYHLAPSSYGFMVQHDSPYVGTVPITAEHLGPWSLRRGESFNVVHKALYGSRVAAVHRSDYEDFQTIRATHRSDYEPHARARAQHQATYSQNPVARASHWSGYEKFVRARAAHRSTYEVATTVRSSLLSKYTLNSTVKKTHVGVHAFTDPLRTEYSSKWDLKTTNPVDTQHSGFWTLEGEGSTLISTVSHLVAAGRTIPLDDAVISSSLETPGWTLRARVASMADYAALQDAMPVQFHYGIDVFQLVVDSKTLKRSGPAPDLQLIARSPVVLLDLPRSRKVNIVVDVPMFVSDVVSSLLEQPVAWEVPDWLIPANKVAFTETSQLQAAINVLKSIGAVIQSDRDGTLRVISSVTVPVTAFEPTLPVEVFTDDEDNLSMAGQHVYAEKFTSFRVSEGETAFNDRLTWELDEGSLTEGTLSLAPSPYRSGLLLKDTQEPKTTNYSLVGEVETEVEDLVEFVQGQGSVSRPVHSLISVTWHSKVLGAPAFSLASNLLSVGTSIDGGYGAAMVKYVTKTIDYRVAGVLGKAIQFLVEEP